MESYNTANDQLTIRPSMNHPHDYVVAALDKDCKIHALGSNDVYPAYPALSGQFTPLTGSYSSTAALNLGGHNGRVKSRV